MSRCEIRFLFIIVSVWGNLRHVRELWIEVMLSHYSYCMYIRKLQPKGLSMQTKLAHFLRNGVYAYLPRRCMRSFNYNSCIDVSQEVSEALRSHSPVVALESTIISHGMPYPANLQTALQVEEVIRNQVIGYRQTFGIWWSIINYRYWTPHFLAFCFQNASVMGPFENS